MNKNYTNVAPTYPNGIPNYNTNQSTYPPFMNFSPYNINEDMRQVNDNNLEYAENVFQLNIGKRITVYSSFPDSLEWRDKVFSGTIVGIGKDYLLLKTDTNELVMLWIIYINYATFDDDINY